METSTKNTLSEDELLANLDAGARSFLGTWITDAFVSHVKLSQVDFSNSYLYRVVFRNVIFENVSFRKCTLQECRFVDCEFIHGSTGGSTENPIYGSISFEDADLSLVAFIWDKQEIGVFRSCRFDRAKLFICIFRNLYIRGNFWDCSVKKSRFIKCDLSDSYGIEFDDNDVTETILPKRRRGSFSFTAIAKRILRPLK